MRIKPCVRLPIIQKMRPDGEGIWVISVPSQKYTPLT